MKQVPDVDELEEQYPERDVIEGSGFLDEIDDDSIIRQYRDNTKYLDIVQKFIAIVQMKHNLSRV